MISSFPKIVKELLADIPQNDYPVLNSRLFIMCWVGFSLDKSLTSMRDLFKRLNISNISVDASTFSKASKHRSLKNFLMIYQKLAQKAQGKNFPDKYSICPIDSTVITLTSKLLHCQKFHQVKLISNLNLSQDFTEENLINFGQEHDYNYGNEMIDSLPEKGIGVMDRGFASLKFLKDSQTKNKYFVLRISQNYKLELIPNSELIKVGTGNESGNYRVVNFCDLKSKVEYRVVTNLPSSGDGSFSNEDVMEIYRQRWGIECFWKFLKMHLKLSELITKNVNGIAIQIYSALIAYLILKLVDIPQEWGTKLLDKLRYLQACMCQEISYIHWMRKIMKS